MRLAYGDPETERTKDVWDLRLFGRAGRLDFSGIRQEWLRQATKAWAATAVVRLRSKNMLQHRVQAAAALSRVLAAGPGGGHDPARLGRSDVDRFLLRVGTLDCPQTGRPYSRRRATQIVEDCACVLREAREMGLLAGLAPTFVLPARRLRPDRRRGGGRSGPPSPRRRPAGPHLGLLRAIPGSPRRPAHGLGAVGDHAGEMAVLAYKLLKGTGRRLGEVASLHLDCLDVDEHAKPVLVYDNHKRQRMGRRLPLADTALVDAIRSQQRWVAERFPNTPPERLWLLPRPNKNADGTAHIGGMLLFKWMRSWVARIPHIDAGPVDEHGEPVPFDRAAIHPSRLPPHLRPNPGRSRCGAVGAARPDGPPQPLGHARLLHDRRDQKREAMEVLARHTVDNRGTALCPRPTISCGRAARGAVVGRGPHGQMLRAHQRARPAGRPAPSATSAPAVPTSRPTPRSCPNCAATATTYDEREAMLAAGVADWAVDGVSRQLDVIVGHIRHHEQSLDRLPVEQRALVEDASVTVRKARQSVPVAFGRRHRDDGDG